MKYRIYQTTNMNILNNLSFHQNVFLEGHICNLNTLAQNCKKKKHLFIDIIICKYIITEWIQPWVFLIVM